MKNCISYYFYELMTGKNIDFRDIFLNEKSYKKGHESILIHDISYKTFMGS